MSAAPNLTVLEGGAAGVLPPHDIEAEAAVISATCIEASVLDMIGFLRAEHFFSEKHARIFEAVLHLRKEGLPPDVVTVGSRLRETGRLEQVGGMGYLIETLNASPTIRNVEAHAKIIHDRWRSRQLAYAGERLAARARTEIENPQGLADAAERAIGRIARDGVSAKEETNTEMLRRIVGQLVAQQTDRISDSAEDTKLRGIPWGIHGLDVKTYGQHATDKTTVVGFAGGGKTAFAVQSAVNTAMRGIMVAFISVEMTRPELLLRSLSHVAMVDGQRLKVGKLTQPEWSRIFACVEQVGELPIKYVDRTDIHVGQIENLVRGLVARPKRDGEAPLGLVVVDYVQALGAPPEMARAPQHEQIADSTKRLKLLAVNTKVHMIELAQAKGDDDKASKSVRPRPGEYDVAGSKAIIKWANNVFYLHTPGMPGPGGKQVPDPKRTTLICTKQRGGPKFDVELDFAGELSRFTDPNDPMRAASRDFVDGNNSLTDGL